MYLYLSSASFSRECESCNYLRTIPKKWLKQNKKVAMGLQSNRVVDRFRVSSSVRWAILREFLDVSSTILRFVIFKFLFFCRFCRRCPFIVLILRFLQIHLLGKSLEKDNWDKREIFYALPFGDLPRDGEADGDGSGLHPLLLPRRLPVPLAFKRTIVSRWRNLKLFSKHIESTFYLLIIGKFF